MDEKEKKVVMRSVKKALKKVLENVEVSQKDHVSFSDAIYNSLSKKAKAILEVYKEEAGQDGVETIIAEGIGDFGGDSVLEDLVSNLLGVNPTELRAAAEYSALRTKHNILINRLSDLTKIKKTNLILSIDYSKNIDERINRLETFLGGLAKRDIEV